MENVEKSKICPKCKFIHKEEFDICPNCSVIVRKYYAIEEKRNNGRKNDIEEKTSINKSFFLKTIILLFLLYGIYSVFRKNDEISHPPGIIVKEEPLQLNTDVKSWLFNDHLITPLAKFAINARVLSKERYFLDRGAELSKYDLALGWQEMSDSKVLSKLSIRQSGRWYFYR